MQMTHNYARMQKPWGENTYVSNRSDWSTSRNTVSSTSDINDRILYTITNCHVIGRTEVVLFNTIVSVLC